MPKTKKGTALAARTRQEISTAKPKRPAGGAGGGMRRGELAQIRKVLLAKRRILTGDVTHMEDEALHKTGQEAASQDISNFAELGSDNFEQEFTIGLIENETEALKEIEAALKRIEAGAFGICETCEKKIGKARIQAIPYARLCIDCKRQEEARAGF